MADIIDTVQLQEVGAVIDLYEITIKGTTVFLYSGLDSNNESVFFPDKVPSTVNQYTAFPLEVTGYEKRSDGPAPRPTLVAANVIASVRNFVQSGDTQEDDLMGILSSIGLENNLDLIGATVVRRRTLEENLVASGDPWATPIEFPSESYIIDRVSAENQVTVTFELASPFDIEGVKVPNRVVVGKYCSWLYQGAFINDGGCRWPLDSTPDGGSQLFIDINDNNITPPAAWSTNPYTIGERVLRTFNLETKYGTKSATQVFEAIRSSTNKPPETNAAYWKRVDICGKTLQSCKARFDPTNTELPGLPFGAFPATRKFK